VILRALEDISISKYIENEVSDVPDLKSKNKRFLDIILEDFKLYDILFEKLDIYFMQNSLPYVNLSFEVLEDPIKCFKYFIRDENFEEIARNTNINAYTYVVQEYWKTIPKLNERYWKNTNRVEIKLFIAILLYMGVNKVNSIKTETFWI
jgi:hypothetical protein